MNEHKLAEKYEIAIRRFQEHVKGPAEDGTFQLVAEDGRSIGIDDPIIFAQLKESLEETNRKIRRDEIDPKQIELDYMP